MRGHKAAPHRLLGDDRFSREEFEPRAADICGLYVNPPENVLVLSSDEKTGIQAKAPVSPPSAPARRRGASTKRPRRPDPLPDQVDAELPVVESQQTVAITDNLSTHGTQEVQDSLHAHPRWSFRFTPKHASWLNQVEMFFSILARRLLKNGIFTSETDLAEQMLAFIETYNQTAQPFNWTYTARRSKHKARTSRISH